MENAPSRIARIVSLPPLSPAAHEMLQIATSEEVNIDALTVLIERDPSLSARLVGMANAAHSASTREIHDLRQAVLRLGTRRVVQLVLGILFATHFNPHRCPAFSAQRWWSSALTTAATTGMLADNLEGLSPSLLGLRLGGLLHNIGILVLTHAWPDEMHDVFRVAASHNRPLSYFARAAFGIEHHEAGGLLCESWKLPSAVSAAVRHHGAAHYEGEWKEAAAAIGWASAWRRLDFRAPPVVEAFPILVPFKDALRALTVHGETLRKEHQELTVLAQRMP